MSAADFREIAILRDGPKAERLFRASVSAFCALTRPSKREIAQLVDLTFPLFASVSVEALRYVSAALSESPHAPRELVLRLCDQSVDIAAPLLIRSPVLTDADLVALIARHGVAHARAIARRAALHPAIGHLVKALEAALAAKATAVPIARPASNPVRQQPASVRPGANAEAARQRLRALMSAKTAQTADEAVPAASGQALHDAAMTGEPALFKRALCAALGIDTETAQSIITSSSYASLITALRALDLTEAQAFPIAAALFRGQFDHPEAIRLFFARYRNVEPDVARERVRGWKVDMVANWIQRQTKGARASRLLPTRNAAIPALAAL